MWYCINYKTVENSIFHWMYNSKFVYDQYSEYVDGVDRANGRNLTQSCVKQSIHVKSVIVTTCFTYKYQ